MNRCLLMLVLVTPAAVHAAEEATDAAVQQAIDRGLAFLSQDAVKWKADHKCVSCHHAGMVVWAMNDARRAGHTVDEPLRSELTNWMLEAGDGRSSLPRPESAPKALNTKGLWFGLTLATISDPQAGVEAGLSKLIATVRSDQAETGAWSAWPETRPPMFGPSDFSATAMATLLLIGDAKTDPASQTSLTQATKWLDNTPPDEELQSTVLKLSVISRLERPAEERRLLISKVTERQNADGGWSQTAAHPSDAWATGQTLMALRDAGVPKTDPALQRGRTFLVTNQQENGSWLMASRPTKPGGDGAKNLIPIIGAGSAWAVIGLSRSQ
ncbi:MAG TPA: prenyltransferase/squalene oxidase repeat-containing protein [Planctomycetaceae bacterium]|nr:prenyltransferase/squalene oxidase repeat-containing protein [Planctomycetaceae bacterium]